MAIIHGRNLIVSIDGRAIAAARSCDVVVSSDTIETSSPTSGLWRDYIAGHKGWSVAVGCLLDAYAIGGIEQIQSVLWAGTDMVGKKVTLSWSELGSSLNRVSGQAIIDTWRVTGTVGNLCQGSFSFTGTGVLS